MSIDKEFNSWEKDNSNKHNNNLYFLYPKKIIKKYDKNLNLLKKGKESIKISSFKSFKIKIDDSLNKKILFLLDKALSYNTTYFNLFNELTLELEKDVNNDNVSSIQYQKKINNFKINLANKIPEVISYFYTSNLKYKLLDAYFNSQKTIDIFLAKLNSDNNFKRDIIFISILMPFLISLENRKYLDWFLNNRLDSIFSIEISSNNILTLLKEKYIELDEIINIQKSKKINLMSIEIKKLFQQNVINYSLLEFDNTSNSFILSIQIKPSLMIIINLNEISK